MPLLYVGVNGIVLLYGIVCQVDLRVERVQVELGCCEAYVRAFIHPAVELVPVRSRDELELVRTKASFLRFPGL